MAVPGVSSIGAILSYGVETTAGEKPASFTKLTRINAIGGISTTRESIDASALDATPFAYLKGDKDIAIHKVKGSDLSDDMFANAVLNGVVLTFNYTVAEDAAAGVFKLSVSEVVRTVEGSDDGIELNFAAVNAEVTIGAAAPEPEECKHEEVTYVSDKNGNHTVFCANEECGADLGTVACEMTEVPKSAIDATCETAGKEADTECALCGYTVEGAAVEALGHNMVETEAAVDATCEAAGKTAVYTCANGCGKTEGGAEVPALGHNMVETEAAVDATCEAAGKTAVSTCANGCGKTEGGVEVPATGHDYEVVVTAPTCETAGYTTYTCACGDVQVKDEVPATGHAWGEWAETVAPQVGVAGEKRRDCANCDAYETEEVPALEAPVVYVAYIGETGYATVQEAVDAVAVLGTVTVAEGVEETVTPKVPFYFAGDLSGITLADGYEMDTTGRYVRKNGAVVEDDVYKYVPAQGTYTIVRPAIGQEGIAEGSIGQVPNLTLESAIILNYHVKDSVIDNYEAFYAVIDLHDENGNIVTSAKANDTAVRMVVTDHINSSLYPNERTMFSLPGTPAKCMNNTVKVTYYGIKADGTIEYAIKESGIATYLTKNVGGATGKLKTLLVEIMNYGAAAQRYFNYNTANLLNATLDASLQRNVLSDFTVTATTVGSSKVELTADETKIFSGVTFSLRLQDSVAPKFELNHSSGIDYTGAVFVMEYVDVYGVAQKIEIPESEWDKSGAKPTVVAYALAAKDMNEIASINVYMNYGTADQARVLATYNRSVVQNYAASNIVTSDDTLNTVCKAILTYGYAAKDYFQSK